jgi:ABC-type sugar transport system permease subunit
LALLTWAFLVGALGGGVALARWRVRLAADDLLRSEAATGARVYQAARDTAALGQLLGIRWRIVAGGGEATDAATVRRGDAGPVGQAPLLDAEEWNVVGRLEAAAAPPPPAGGLPTIVAALIAALLLAPVVWRWTGAAARWPAVAALALVAVPLAVADRGAASALRHLSDRRLALARGALDAVPDAGAVLAQPGGVHRLTGLAFLPHDSSAGAVTGLPTAALEILRSAPPPPGAEAQRITADHITYAVADAPVARLVFLPYEHTHRPAPLLMLAALIGLALAAPAAALARLAPAPRAFHRTAAAWSFLAPALLHLAVFTVGPLAFAAWLSLHRWSLLDAARPFVGLANFVDVLTDPAWWNAIGNTVVFALHVPVAMALALGLALLTRRGRGATALRAVFFLPTITSLVAVAIVWQWMLHGEYGLINAALGLAGLGPVPWLTSPRTALVALMLMSVWLVVGYQMVIFQAGLAAIPRDLYDAARIDGAGAWRRFLHVTLPGLRPTIFFVLVTSIIGSFQIFGAVYVMTEGGPLHATDVAVFHIYEEAWEYFRFGRAAAMSWVLFALVFGVTWLQFRAVERRVEA